jgi:hypothetical protein
MPQVCDPRDRGPPRGPRRQVCYSCNPKYAAQRRPPTRKRHFRLEQIGYSCGRSISWPVHRLAWCAIQWRVWLREARCTGRRLVVSRPCTDPLKRRDGCRKYCEYHRDSEKHEGGAVAIPFGGTPLYSSSLDGSPRGMQCAGGRCSERPRPDLGHNRPRAANVRCPLFTSTSR